MVRTIEQPIDRDYRSCYDKPRGLWVSVDGEDDWQAWCTSESFDGLRGTRYRVHLTPNANVLVLPTPNDLCCFRERYGVLEPRTSSPRPYIPWEVVAKDYQGIIISPYHWTCRMEENWYYGWDCASGCIWSSDAIACVEALKEAA